MSIVLEINRIESVQGFQRKYHLRTTPQRTKTSVFPSPAVPCKFQHDPSLPTNQYPDVPVSLVLASFTDDLLNLIGEYPIKPCVLPKIRPYRHGGSCLAIQEFVITVAVAVAACRFHSNFASRSLPKVFT